MHDKMNFQPEAFPLEALIDESGESDAELEGELEADLEEERGGGRFRQGFSARRGGPSRYARARRRPRRQPRPRRQQWPGKPGRPDYPWPPRPRWPYVAWPGGGSLTVTDTAADDWPAEPAFDDAAPPDPGAPDAGAPVDAGGGDEELFGSNTANIIDLTATADKSKRKGTRDPKTVYALVLHQMACCFAPQDPLKRFLTVGAHFAIANDGRILQLHPVSTLLWASNGFNNRSVAVEFAGNFPNTRGRWWQGSKYGMNRPTPAQVTAGRQLIRYLMQTMGLTHVLAHRQSSGTRENDPGPDIWFDVGQWAVNTLGLKDGGPGFKIDTGNAIPEEWRTWGPRRPAVTPEVTFEQETSMPETEIVHDEWDREQRDPGKEPTMHNRHCGCRRCASAETFEAQSFQYGSGGGFGEMESAMSEEQEMDLALELLTVSSEAELDQFLGKLIKGAWKGIKKGPGRQAARRRAQEGGEGGAADGGRCARLVHSDPRRWDRGRLRARRRDQQGAGNGNREPERRRSRARSCATIRAHRDERGATGGRGPVVLDEETAATQAVAAAARKYLPNFQVCRRGRNRAVRSRAAGSAVAAKSRCSARDETPHAYVHQHRGRFLSELAELVRYPSVQLGSAARCGRAPMRRMAGASPRPDRARGRAPLRDRRTSRRVRPLAACGGPSDGVDLRPLRRAAVRSAGRVDVAAIRAGRSGTTAVRPRRRGRQGADVHAPQGGRGAARTRGALPVNVKCLIEGEEEIGSTHLPAFLAAHRPEVTADAAVVSDMRILGPTRRQSPSRCAARSAWS